jgi:hypothetical protein
MEKTNAEQFQHQEDCRNLDESMLQTIAFSIGFQSEPAPNDPAQTARRLREIWTPKNLVNFLDQM